MTIVISSGHGLKVRGASGIIDEVDEARRVVNALGPLLAAKGIETTIFHDDISTSQNENLNRIVDFHNSKKRDLDISVHFNAYEQVSGPMGTEVLYTTQDTLADEMSAAISGCGFINRGGKQRNDLFFLNQTSAPAILIEVCFVDSMADCDLYENSFDVICCAIVDCLTGETNNDIAASESPVLFRAKGKCSYFGGPNDTGVSADEGLAFISDMEDAPHLFLPETNDTFAYGLARRLNPFVHYVACRWNYSVTPKNMLLEHFALVRSVETGRALKALPADWGPHEDTGRIADLSPSLMEDLQLMTDGEVEVIFPFQEFEY